MYLALIKYYVIYFSVLLYAAKVSFVEFHELMWSVDPPFFNIFKIKK
jgi:hypothetical protein